MVKSAIKLITEDVIEDVANRFRALGEANRLRIVRSLQNGEKNVTELVNQTGMSQPNVSRHLLVLLNSGLIGRRKEGLNVMYRITDKSLAQLCEIVCKSVSS